MSAIELKGFRFVDMTAAFDEVGTRTYRDLIHTEQPANFLIADQIYEVLHGVWAEHAHSDLSD